MKDLMRRIRPYRVHIAALLFAAAVGLWYLMYVTAPSASPQPQPTTQRPAPTPAAAPRPKPVPPATVGKPMVFVLPPLLEEREPPPAPLPQAEPKEALASVPASIPPGNPFTLFPKPEKKKPTPAPPREAKKPTPVPPPPPPEPPPPPKAVLEVYTDPPAARVYLNGKPLGVTPLKSEVEPGRHALLIEAPDREPYTRTLTLEPGQDMVLTLYLPPKPKPPAKEKPVPKIEQLPRAPEAPKPQAGAEVPPSPARLWAEEHRVRLVGAVLGPVPVALIEVDGHTTAVTPGEEIVPGSGARLVGVGPTTAVIAYRQSSLVLRVEEEEE